MKAWELMEQLRGRDPSGEVVLTLNGGFKGGFKYAAKFDLSSPAHRRIVLETDSEEIGVDTTELEDEVAALGGMVDDLQSALQKITKALDDYREDKCLPPLEQAIEDARDISTKEKP